MKWFFLNSRLLELIIFGHLSKLKLWLILEIFSKWKMTNRRRWKWPFLGNRILEIRHYLRNVDIPCALLWHRYVGALRLYPKLVWHVAAPHDHLSWSWWAYHSCTLYILQSWIASFNRACWPRQRSFRSTLIPTQGPSQPNWTYCRCSHSSSTFTSLGRLIHF